MTKVYEKSTDEEGKTILYEIETTKIRTRTSLEQIDNLILGAQNRVSELEAEKVMIEALLR